jgi:anti-anti-sigma factor
MEIDRQTAAGVATLVVRGRLDAAWSGPLGDTLQQAVRDGFHDVRLHLAGVSFLSSGGIRVLLTHWKELRRVQGRFAIIAPSPEVERTLRLAGLAPLLDAPLPPAPASTESTTTATSGVFAGPGFTGELDPLAAGARFRGRFLGLPPSSATPSLPSLASATLQPTALPCGTLALGLGAFGTTVGECQPELGELLAVGGVAASLPAGEANQPDYVVTAGDLAPEIMFAQGLAAEGAFAFLARFEVAENSSSVALGDLLSGLLAGAGGPRLAFAAVVESAGLIGAHLRRSPAAPRADKAFEFPAVRDWLTFTPEPAYANTVALLVGVATTEVSGPLADFTRPLAPGGSLRAHVHAAVFPYRPVRHGRLDLAETAASLFEAGRVLGVLHLLSDQRPGGAGESRFYRGALWAAPLDI